jgi:hypothetical protein
MAKLRGDKGFIQIGDEPRQVRSLRATNHTWQLLSEEAQRQRQTIADLIENWANPQHVKNDVQRGKAIALLTEALALRPNAGGAIKAKIREALQILE